MAERTLPGHQLYCFAVQTHTGPIRLGLVQESCGTRPYRRFIPRTRRTCGFSNQLRAISGRPHPHLRWGDERRRTAVSDSRTDCRRGLLRFSVLRLLLFLLSDLRGPIHGKPEGYRVKCITAISHPARGRVATCGSQRLRRQVGVDHLLTLLARTGPGVATIENRRRYAPSLLHPWRCCGRRLLGETYRRAHALVTATYRSLARTAPCPGLSANPSLSLDEIFRTFDSNARTRRQFRSRRGGELARRVSVSGRLPLRRDRQSRAVSPRTPQGARVLDTQAGAFHAVRRTGESSAPQ